MARSSYTSPLAFGLLNLLLVQWTTALDISYCSPDNNSGGSRFVSSIYMSNGRCADNCRGSYVFAVLQGTNCYCSNYVPSNQESSSSCNSPCPGYPSDLCGNPGDGLWAYISLGGTPSGTSGGDGSSGSPTSPSNTENPTQVYTSVISVPGTVRTVIVTPTASPSDSALGQTGSGGLSGGKVAGIVIGAAVGIGLIVGLGVFIWLRRRHQKNIDAISEGGSYTSPSNASKNGNIGVPSRQVSQMSSAGLLAKIPRIATGGFGFNDDPRSAATSTSNHDRNSTHMTVDQRLNPWAIYSNEDSRASNVSLQDNQDYSRQLRVANPDP